MKFSHILASLAASVAFAGAAQSATLNLTDGGVAGGFAAGVIPGGTANNQLLGPLGLSNPLDGFFGSQVELQGNANITIDFYGWEASFKNDFNFGGNELFTTGATDNIEVTPIGTPLASFSGFASAGLLDFSFDVDSDRPGATITNGDENDDVIRGFFASFHNDAGATSGNQLWLFLDDGGAGPNDNHDDLAVLITVAPVPLPASGLMLLAGLGGVAAMRRRQKKA